ncbi:AEC family transporter [Acidisphaera sp. L21]|jgi:malonate transporter|uniref:AEC family transporter n=1 Tax=Acidisphaera sp. L21 TaxID=1641851 RepID=UPI00131EBD06|nr:AEC family transporter [Acidisphaera sp. L21]
MSSLSMIVQALVPVAFVIILGLLAGRLGLVKSTQSAVLATLALDFCLPALLFTATAKLTLPELENWQFFVGIAAGLLSVYLIALAISLVAFRKPVAASALQALNSAFPNMAFMGVPVLIAVIGTSAMLSVVIGNLISSFLLLPLTLTLLEAGKPRQKDASRGAVIWTSVLGAIKQPLVWAPLAGIAFALIQFPLPEFVAKSFNLIGVATSGVALFALGLVLSGQKFSIGWAALLNVFCKVALQPAVMLGFAVLFNVVGVYRREMILLAALPTASMTAMFAVEYDVYVAESDATILLSTIISIATLGILIGVTA